MSHAVLTIDDAPSATLHEKLAVLERLDASALLFCEGRRLSEHADQARRALEAGHHLGNHTYSHTHASELTVPAFRREVDRTEALLDRVYERAGRERPARVFRFPYGDRGTPRTAAAFQRVLARRGFRPPDVGVTYDWWQADHADVHDWFWTVELGDWAVEGTAELRQRVLEVPEFDDPSPDVVLFHDSGVGLRLLETLLEALRERGVRLAEPALVQG